MTPRRREFQGAVVGPRGAKTRTILQEALQINIINTNLSF